MFLKEEAMKSQGSVFVDAFVFAWSIAMIIFMVIPCGMIFLYEVATNKPQPMQRYEMTGEVNSYSLVRYPTKDNDYNQFVIILLVSREEWQRVQQNYEKPQGYSMGKEDFPGRPGYVIYGRHSTGEWCGPLPPPGTLVKVSSMTGYTRNVRIFDLQTERMYMSYCQ